MSNSDRDQRGRPHSGKKCPEAANGGCAFTQAEIGNVMPNQPELHNGWRPEDMTGRISLRWHPKC